MSKKFAEKIKTAFQLTYEIRHFTQNVEFSVTLSDFLRMKIMSAHNF